MLASHILNIKDTKKKKKTQILCRLSTNQTLMHPTRHICENFSHRKKQLAAVAVFTATVLTNASPDNWQPLSAGMDAVLRHF